MNCQKSVDYAIKSYSPITEPQNRSDKRYLKAGIGYIYWAFAGKSLSKIDSMDLVDEARGLIREYSDIKGGDKDVLLSERKASILNSFWCSLKVIEDEIYRRSNS